MEKEPGKLHCGVGKASNLRDNETYKTLFFEVES